MRTFFLDSVSHLAKHNYSTSILPCLEMAASSCLLDLYCGHFSLLKSELANLLPCEFKLAKLSSVDTLEKYGDYEDWDSTCSWLLSPVACWVVSSEKSTPVCC